MRLAGKILTAFAITLDDSPLWYPYMCAGKIYMTSEYNMKYDRRATTT